MEIFKRITVIICLFLLAHLTSIFFGQLFCSLFARIGGSICQGDLFMSTSSTQYLVGIAPAFIFFDTLFFTYLAKKYDYILMTLLLILPLIYLLAFDSKFSQHTIFYILIGILGWIIGFFGRKLFIKNKPGISAK